MQSNQPTVHNSQQNTVSGTSTHATVFAVGYGKGPLTARGSVNVPVTNGVKKGERHCHLLLVARTYICSTSIACFAEVQDH